MREAVGRHVNPQLLDEYFPHFVHERLIRDLVVFNFHGEGKSMRAYVEQVFQAADFLQCEATEQQLVERVVMNFHPDILRQAAFLDKPRSLQDLRRVAGLTEEKFAVLKERRRLDQGMSGRLSACLILVLLLMCALVLFFSYHHLLYLSFRTPFGYHL